MNSKNSSKKKGRKSTLNATEKKDAEEGRGFV